MNLLILAGLVVSLGLVGPSACDEVDDVLDCAPKVVLDARSLERSFLLLESTLRAKVNASELSDDFESLVEAAKGLGSQPKPLASGDTDQNRSLKKAIRKFAKLDASLTQCNFNGYYTLASNYKAALNCDLLQAAIREAIKRHGINCRPSYLDQFNRLRVNKSLLAKIDKLIDQRVLNRIMATDNKTTADLESLIVRNNLWGPIRKVDELLLGNIVQSGTTSRQAKLFKPSERQKSKDQLTFEERLRIRVYERQLIKPCKRFVREFAEIFYPAKLDLAQLENSPNGPRENLAQTIQDNQMFTDTWVKFRICQAIKEDIAGVLKRISAEADKMIEPKRVDQLGD